MSIHAIVPPISNHGGHVPGQPNDRIRQPRTLQLGASQLRPPQLRSRKGAAAPLAIRSVFGCPLFQRSDAGWLPLPETQPGVP